MKKWIMQDKNTKSENQIKLLNTWIKVLNKGQQYLKRISQQYLIENFHLFSIVLTEICIIPHVDLKKSNSALIIKFVSERNN